MTPRYSRRYNVSPADLDVLLNDAAGTPATGTVKGDGDASPFTVVGALIVDTTTDTIKPITSNISTKEST